MHILRLSGYLAPMRWKTTTAVCENCKRSWPVHNAREFEQLMKLIEDILGVAAFKSEIPFLIRFEIQTSKTLETRK